MRRSPIVRESSLLADIINLMALRHVHRVPVRVVTATKRRKFRT